MVVVPKSNGKPRRTIDYQELNKYCVRETHHTRAPFDMVSSVPQHTFKTTLDTFWGFHQVRLAVESRPLTTFITPWGRNRYLRTPMGHVSVSDTYTRRYDDAVIDVERKFKCVEWTTCCCTIPACRAGVLTLLELSGNMWKGKCNAVTG